MEYQSGLIEEFAKNYWKKNKTYKVENDFSKPKFYILDMFPYPSGAGLHVGHPLGYIASDIYARYKKQKGFNVLHPMGFDAFGLPAEQYALETGQHPADTTEKNIARYKEQLDKIGFCFDWEREVRTADPHYYKWTQWIFLQLYNAWYNPETNKAEPIECLKNKLLAADDKFKNEVELENELMKHRLAYRSKSTVNWCEALGTVLANDEVVNGVSERGGHPVVKKEMNQWFLRITKFADRLLEGLERVDFPESLKDMQRNWIGRSEGAELVFKVNDLSNIPVFTTRPDTIYGVSFLVLAPEHTLVESITTSAQRQAIKDYQKYVASRSDRERMAETKKITGCFTGAFAPHPFTGELQPIWVSEYVLAGYGTGAIMGVPCGDECDFAFAKHFNLPIPNIFEGIDISEKAYIDKNVTLTNSDFLNGLKAKDALKKAIEKIEEKEIGTKKINYRMRDAGFSRQRYWGEPFPIVYNEVDVPIALDENDLPLELPHLETYSAGPNGQGPLANATNWVSSAKGRRETDTMPGYAGSSWYYLRYMDPHNEHSFCDKKVSAYWNQVDVYVGGAEHAVGHLLYSRMWCKALNDLGFISFDEPYKKLINQGMILGMSATIYKVQAISYTLNDETLPFVYKLNIFVSSELAKKVEKKFLTPGISEYESAYSCFINQCEEIKKNNNLNYISNSINSFKIEFKKHIDIGLINDKTDQLNVTEFRNSHEDFKFSEFIFEEDGSFLLEREQDKMSKSKRNVINPDDIVAQYGADVFRMYEMFLGPIEISKPWDTKGIEGVSRFIKKLWRLFFDEQNGWLLNTEQPTEEEQKIIHKCILKIGTDIERFSFNTAVSQLMITVNELTALNCHKQEILEKLTRVIAPFAPHTAEYLWQKLGYENAVVNAEFPTYNIEYTTENTKVYPVAINGKTRAELEFSIDATQEEIEQVVLSNKTIIKWMEEKTPKKIIFVKGKMINIVI